MVSHLTRRKFLQLLIAAGVGGSKTALANQKVVRIGITPVFLTEMTSVLRDWQTYLENKMGQAVIFVQRDSYREIVTNLLANRLDFAWICGFPFVANSQILRLTAVPVYKEKQLYQSYFIVPERDTSTTSILDLERKVFTFTDRDSNSGYLVPRFKLKESQKDPNTFFRKTFFCGSHRNAVKAVSKGLADGACVDGYVWDSLTRFNSDITRQTRLVKKSDTYGFPPIVSASSVSNELHTLFELTLKTMHQNPDGRAILDQLNIDGFASGHISNYSSIKEMAVALGEL